MRVDKVDLERKREKTNGEREREIKERQIKEELSRWVDGAERAGPGPAAGVGQSSRKPGPAPLSPTAAGHVQNLSRLSRPACRTP